MCSNVFQLNGETNLINTTSLISTDDDMIDIINNSNPNYNYTEATNSNVNMAEVPPRVPRPASPTHTAFGGRDFIDHEGKNFFTYISVCFCCSNWFF